MKPTKNIFTIIISFIFTENQIGVILPKPKNQPVFNDFVIHACLDSMIQGRNVTGAFVACS
jgi:hypothetical protein